MPVISSQVCLSWFGLPGLLVSPVSFKRHYIITNLLTCIGFLLFRVLKTGSDGRFDEIRSHFLKFLSTSRFVLTIYALTLSSILDIPDHLGLDCEPSSHYSQFPVSVGYKDRRIKSGLWNWQRHRRSRTLGSRLGDRNGRRHSESKGYIE